MVFPLLSPIGTNHADSFSQFFFFPQLSKMLTKLKFPSPHNALAENLGHLGQHMNLFLGHRSRWHLCCVLHTPNPDTRV